jgi:hypothetical protein
VAGSGLDDASLPLLRHHVEFVPDHHGEIRAVRLTAERSSADSGVFPRHALASSFLNRGGCIVLQGSQRWRSTLLSGDGATTLLLFAKGFKSRFDQMNRIAMPLGGLLHLSGLALNVREIRP